jgi:integrase
LEVQPIREKRKLSLLKDALLRKSYRDYCFFTLGINTGLRVGDILKLRVGDVVNGDGKIKRYVNLKEQKTGKYNEFELSIKTREMIQTQVNQLRFNDESDYLFPSRKGSSAITRQHAFYIINEGAKIAGIEENVGTHTMRKTFGYWAYKGGVPLPTIMSLLNHSSQKDTLRYIGITREEKMNVFVTLDL